MKQFNRRQFLKSSALLTASFGLLPGLRASSSKRVPGANGDVRFAVVGFNGRGKDHLKESRELKGARLVALCDVDQRVLDREVKKAGELGEQVEGYTDIRKLLENKDIDVVTFATPNHWHALGAIWAVQAGKDVYLEKPVSHEVWEGRQIVEAARKYNRIVQTGTQSRSSSGIHDAIQWAREGHLGKILRARGLCYKRRPSIGKVTAEQPIPPGIDYDLWCGPAPKEPLKRKNLHYDWHWVWPTGNGDLGNQGIHQMDIARWVLGESALSPRVISVGGRVGYDDDGTTPNTLIVFHDYKAAPLIFEVRGLPAVAEGSEMDEYHGGRVGVVVDLEGGLMLIPNYSSAVFYDKERKEVKSFKGGSSHFGNFLKAVHSRNHSDLNADILEGHLSSALCHTGNISYRLGKTYSPDKLRAKVKDNADLAESLGRMEEHLKANNVDSKKYPVTLGAALKMDPQTERFIGNSKANKLLTREFRKPFVVPEKV